MQPDLVTPVAEEPMVAPVAPVPLVAAPRRAAVPSWAKILLSTPLTAVGIMILAAIVILALFGPLLSPYQPLDMLGPLGG